METEIAPELQLFFWLAGAFVSRYANPRLPVCVLRGLWGTIMLSN